MCHGTISIGDAEASDGSSVTKYDGAKSTLIRINSGAPCSLRQIEATDGGICSIAPHLWRRMVEGDRSA
jgi:hypothetical protein